MRKKIFLIILFLFISLPVFSIELNGGVAFNVNSARDYVNDGRINNAVISGHKTFVDDETVEKVVYTYGKDGSVIGSTVQYKGDTDKAYIYGRDNRLRNMDKYDRDVDLYPHRGYRYDLNGNLILMSLTVSKNEQFRFSPDGELIAHSINGIIYDENGNIIGVAK